jgi:hypothetical protein
VTSAGAETLYLKITMKVLPSLKAFCILFAFVPILIVMMLELEIGSGKSKHRMIFNALFWYITEFYIIHTVRILTVNTFLFGHLIKCVCWLAY